MNQMVDLNAYFNPLNKMTRADFEFYASQGRLWSTSARFNQLQAMMIMGPPPVGYHYPIGDAYYEGYVVTTRTMDEREAKDIVGRRGWNESLVWMVLDSKPMGHNPMELFKN